MVLAIKTHNIVSTQLLSCILKSKITKIWQHKKKDQCGFGRLEKILQKRRSLHWVLKDKYEFSIQMRGAGADGKAFLAEVSEPTGEIWWIFKGT